MRIQGYMISAVLAWSSLQAAESATKLSSDESATLFPALGWRNPAGAGWLIEFHGWVYEQEPRRASVAVLQNLLELKIEDLSAEEQRHFKERSRWFLVDNERGKNLSVTLGGITIDLGETESDGHVEKIIAVVNAKSSKPGLNEGTNVMALNLSEKDAREIQGAVHLVGEEGWTVVSDIDDTIKVTEVKNKDALARTHPKQVQRVLIRNVTGETADAERYRTAFHGLAREKWAIFKNPAEVK